MQEKLTINESCVHRECVPLAPQTGNNKVVTNTGVKTAGTHYFRHRGQ